MYTYTRTTTSIISTEAHSSPWDERVRATRRVRARAGRSPAASARRTGPRPRRSPSHVRARVPLRARAGPTRCESFCGPSRASIASMIFFSKCDKIKLGAPQMHSSADRLRFWPKNFFFKKAAEPLCRRSHIRSDGSFGARWSLCKLGAKARARAHLRARGVRKTPAFWGAVSARAP